MSSNPTWSETQFSEAVKSSFSVTQVLISLGLVAAGGNYKTVKVNIAKLGLDTSHWVGRIHPRNKGNPRPQRSLSEILVENSTYTNNDRLKTRLIRGGEMKYECSECTISVWKEKPLTLHLDHINGVNNDNRAENLRLLCPNCHSQTDTYCGRNIGKGRDGKKSRKARTDRPPDSPLPTEKKCCDCSCAVSKDATRCKSCNAKRQPTKISWPSREDLLRMISDSSVYSVSKQLDVSFASVKKRSGITGSVREFHFVPEVRIELTTTPF